MSGQTDQGRQDAEVAAHHGDEGDGQRSKDGEHPVHRSQAVSCPVEQTQLASLSRRFVA